MTAPQPRILLRVDANNQVGMGHAVRLAGLVNSFRTSCELVVAGNDQTLKSMFPQALLYMLASNDTSGLQSMLQATKPDLVIVDLPPSLERPWLEIRGAAPSVPIVALDDEGGAIDADLIINGTVLEQYHRYICPSRARILCGAKYSMIRPVFSAYPWEKTGASVAIVVGSGERAESWALMLASGIVDMSTWGTIRMVVGHSFQQYSRLESLCRDTGISLKRAIPGEELASLISQSAVALVTGGMIVYEVLAMGVPSVVFPQIPNLVPEAAWFSAQEAILDLTYDGGMRPAVIEKAVGHLLDNREEALTMSQNQRRLIDGRGMERAAYAIENLLLESR